MNRFPNMQILPKSVKTRSNIPLDSCHLTTMNFGATNLTYCQELVPSDKISVDMSALAQLSPMVVPTMGEASLYARAFFVPFRFVWKHWEDFFSGKTATNTGSTIYEVPQIGNYTLSYYFLLLSSGYVTNVNSSVSHDFVVVLQGSGGATTYYKRLSSRGNRFMQILNTLGYHITPFDETASTSNTEYYSALPLLSLAKVFRDYYVNPNYDYSDLDALLEGDLLTDGSSGRYLLSSSDLDLLFTYIEWAWFDNDIFNSAWLSPERPMFSEQFKSEVYNVTDTYGSTIEPADNSSYPTALVQSTTSIITETALNALLGIRNFVMRQSATGGRYVDQLLSRFGIKLEPNEARRATFLGSTEFGLNISRVDATSAGTDGTSTSQLGDFTGRGTMNGGGHFEFANDKNDFGMFFIISHIIPKNHYWQGDLPHVEHKTLYDFFQGDVENVGLAPINNNFVFHDFHDITDYTNSADNIGSVFGYAPNYWEYKTGFDRLTGNFALTSRNTEIKSFHMFRDVELEDTTTGNIVPTLGETFQIFNEDIQTQFDRIFLNQDNDYDPFIISFRFKINCNRPMQSIGTSLYADLKEHGGEIGDAVKVRPNGKYF